MLNSTIGQFNNDAFDVFTTSALQRFYDLLKDENDKEDVQTKKR